jgi:FixJ family two-component response regulator
MAVKRSSRPATANGSQFSQSWHVRTAPIVHVVDGDDAARRIVHGLLGAAGYASRGYASAGEFLSATVDDVPGCLVLEVRLQGWSGLELQHVLSRRRCALPVIFLTGHGDIPTSVRAIKAGAVDFLTKPAERAVLMAAVQGALEIDARNRLRRESSRALRARFDALTARERDVFVRVINGKLNKEIAADLGTAERTIKAHRAHLMEKLNVGSVAELVHVSRQLES